MKIKVFLAFTKKEFVESARTYKLFIIIAVFFLFGMLNPILAKMLPELLPSLMPEGMVVSLPAPAPLDSWMQYYKNMSTQLILFVIIFSGVIANELSKGTLINMLTKGLSRKTIILSKFTATTILWSLGYLICFLTTFAYTLYLLPGELPNILFSAFCMWLFGVLILSFMLLGGVLFGNIYGSLLVTGGFAVLFMILGIAPKLEKYNPYLLSSKNINLLTSKMAMSDFTISILITSFLILTTLVGSILVFDKKQL